MEVHHLVFVLAFLFVAPSLSPILAKTPLLALTRKVIKVEYFENCDQTEYPFAYEKFSFARNGSALVINGEVIVSRDIKNPVKIQFLIEKCKDKSNPDTCEYYTTWKWDDVQVTSNLPFVKPIVDSLTPPMSFPLKKNHHYVKNAAIHAHLVEAFLAYSNPNVLWNFRVKLEEETSIKVSCVKFGVRLMNMRVRI